MYILYIHDQSASKGLPTPHPRGHRGRHVATATARKANVARFSAAAAAAAGVVETRRRNGGCTVATPVAFRSPSIDPFFRAESGRTSCFTLFYYGLYITISIN